MPSVAHSSIVTISPHVIIKVADMDFDQFDALAARLGKQLTRRRSLGVFGLLGASGASIVHDIDAKKKKKGKKGKGGKKKPKPTPTQPPTTPPGSPCTDGIKNGDETDVDCGGSCPRCAAGKSCQTRDDCQSAICEGPSGFKTCQTCTPGTQCNFDSLDICVCDQTVSGQIVCDMGDEATTATSCAGCPVGTSCVPMQFGAGFLCYTRCHVR